MKNTLDYRRAELAKIHLAKKRLHLDDNTYRDLLERLTRAKGGPGLRSASAMTRPQRLAVLKYFKDNGAFGPAEDRTAGRPTGSTMTPLMTKIEAILTEKKKPWAYATGMAKRMFKVDRVDWLTEEQQLAVVAALSIHQRRGK